MKIQKLMLIVISLVLLLFIAGCADLIEKIRPAEQTADGVVEPVADEVVDKEVTAEPEEVLAESTCRINAECEQGKLCIDGSCGTIADLYNTDCIEKCSVNKIVVTTSDGETYELSKGQGSYSFAGAVEWSIKPFPDYCQVGDVNIPIGLKKKNLGVVLEEEVVTLSKGETSKAIKHPTVKRIDFTVTLKEILESC